MKLFVSALALFAAAAAAPAADGPLSYSLKSIDGKPVKLSKFKGKVVLLVNVASKCGLTPQYEGLQALYEKYKGDGLVVIGVPANEFGRQEPGTNAEIKEFCTSRYSVTFPMMAKIKVKGEGIDPLYKYLTTTGAGPKGTGDVSWNFEKFLIGRDGQLKARFAPRTKPANKKFTKAVEKELKAGK